MDLLEILANKVDRNAERITRLEEGLADIDQDNRESHHRIEVKVDAIADDVSGFKYMATGAKWIAGIIIGLAMWIAHEWHLLKTWFKS